METGTQKRVGGARGSTGWSILGLLAMSIAAGISIAILASHRPFAVYSLLSAACLVVSGLRLLAVMGRQKIGERLAQAHPEGMEAIRKHGVLFWLWFDQHNLLWAMFALGLGFAMLYFFGPANNPMIVLAAGLSCAVWAIFGAMPVVRPRTLGLCWRSPFPQAPRGLLEGVHYAGNVMLLGRRRNHAQECDWSCGGASQLLVTEVRELTTSGRRAPALRFWVRELENRGEEHKARALVMSAVFLAALLLAAFLVPRFAGQASLSFSQFVSRLAEPMRGGSGSSGGRSGGGGSQGQQQSGKSGQFGSNPGSSGASGQQNSGGQGQSGGSGSQSNGAGSQSGQQQSAGSGQSAGAGQSGGNGKGSQTGQQNPTGAGQSGGNGTGSQTGQQNSTGAGQSGGNGTRTQAGQQNSTGAGQSGGNGSQPGGQKTGASGSGSQSGQQGSSGNGQAGGSGPPGGKSSSSKTGSASSKGPGGESDENSGPTHSWGTSGPAPRKASQPVTLPPLAHNPGEIINIEIPGHWPATGNPKEQPKPTQPERSRDAPANALPYRPIHDANPPAGDASHADPIQPWPNWVYSILHK